MDDAAAQRNAAQLDELVEDTSALSATLKRRIKALEAQGGPGRDGQIRKQQVCLSFWCPALDGKEKLRTDSFGEVKIRGGYPELPICGATIPHEVQAKNGEAI